MRRVRTIETATLVEWGLIGTEPMADSDVEDTFSGFRERELRVLEKTNVKLARMLSRNKTKFRLFFALDESIAAALDNELEEGPARYSEIRRVVAEWGNSPDAIPKHDGNAVNVILRGMGDAFDDRDNLPPTPWIVIHWIAHGVLKTGATPGRLSDTPAYAAVEDAIGEAIEMLYGVWLGPLSGVGGPKSSEMAELATKFIHSVFTFRSARKGILRNFWEGVHEAFTEWLTTGRIKVRQPPDELKAGRTHAGIGYDQKDSYVGEVMDDMLKALDKAFENVLADAKGKWYLV